VTSFKKGKNQIKRTFGKCREKGVTAAVLVWGERECVSVSVHGKSKHGKARENCWIYFKNTPIALSADKL